MKIIVPLVFNPYEFGRASPATYYDEDGLLTTASEDVLRFGYDPTSLDFLGPIIENAATNYLLQSTDFNSGGGTVWTNDTAITPRPAEVNPTGSTGADELNVSFSTASTSQFMGSGDMPSGTAMFSVFVKGLTPNASGFYTVRLNINSSVTTTGVISFNPADYYALESWTGIQKLPNDWFRIWIYGPWDSVTGGSFGISHVNSGSAQRTLLWGAQTEIVSLLGSVVPTSFIFTDATSESRAADIFISQSPSLVESNVDENDAPVWSSLTTYNEGDEVMVLGEYHKTYFATRTTLDDFPPDNLISTETDSQGVPIPPPWVLQGSTNRWRMLDMTTGIERTTVATDSDNSIRVLIALDDVVDAVALFNITGTHVTIRQRDGEGNEIYLFEQDMLSDPDEPFWWGFFWGNRDNTGTIIRTDLPPELPSTLEIIIEGSEEPAQLGKLVIGDAISIGCARFGSSAGIIDFSIKERDEFGNTRVLPRRYIDRCDYDIIVDTEDTGRIKRLLTQVRATPVVFLGSESEKYEITAVFGFFRDFNIVLSGPKKSACTIQAESI